MAPWSGLANGDKFIMDVFGVLYSYYNFYCQSDLAGYNTQYVEEKVSVFLFFFVTGYFIYRMGKYICKG